MTAYYNEYEKSTAAWLRELIREGIIAPGVVDDRSIEDVRPADLIGFKQCHFFAGIGVWSFALRAAGWADDRPIWTGSCPCQPFSAAGQGAAFDDERHLWPAFHHLISQCRPSTILGEQVASKDVDPWIDLVQDDMEGLGYRFGAIPFPSAGVGAPHIRDRLYWMADTSGKRRDGRQNTARQGRRSGPKASSSASGLADPNGRDPGAERQQCSRQQRQQPEDGGIGGLAYPSSQGLSQQPRGRVESARFTEANGDSGAEPTNGFWRDSDWLGCTDGKWRPVEPGTFPLAHGAATRVLRLRGYGNAINAQAAKAWVEIVMDDLA